MLRGFEVAVQQFAQKQQVRAASKDLRRLFPDVPRRVGGGAKTKRSTYLHLLVNWLEFEALKRAAGSETGERMLAATSDGSVYGWVYRQVRDRHEDIGSVVRRHALLGPLADPAVH